ncbi:S-adenosylmethionine:tRNA ribosyltransferase-isomerase [Nocardia sp. SYP-A9097]|uniref:S-adenosylmethionine:tRNA ribosyltransferase-isomerase n=1 Tax=Nocardia sp. SYP-A9097 TaxID=2663237 RepID=UPI00129AE79D|nr:S-adenosylmethionine:tRNA ribosyltransferase-isomerase [Nocardia sp. SYP-A9097]MRH88977.1 S-adenosylmethionine:tRNA ribosyltransferase-isomerase [Nocardia sp. SYP-A9097]
MTVELAAVEFTLPDALNATSPPEARGLARDEVRLLVSQARVLTHARFRELPDFLRPGDLVVVNNSAMVTAAVAAWYGDDAAVLHFSTRLDDGGWVVELRDQHGTPWVGASPEAGAAVLIPGGHRAILRGPWLPEGRRLWIADIDTDVPELLARYGRPITYSYVTERWSPEYYRTVFGREPGSAEMPSAGRPFTEALITELVARGIGLATITLHTGVSSPENGEPPSPERFAVPELTAELANLTHALGGRVVAVGTTVTRALESAVGADGLVHAAAGWTDLVLGCAHPARVVDGLITGWHAPGASHLHLLEAVAGPEAVRRAYRVALDSGYLWHEFGDTALLFADRAER